MTLPLVVRSVQPVLIELDLAEEEAARVLGAGRLDDLSQGRVPGAAPGHHGGSVAGIRESLGEFGAIVFVSGNIPNKTLTAPVLITQLLNPSSFGANTGPGEAAAVASLLFGFSFVVVLVTERISSQSLQGASQLERPVSARRPGHSGGVRACGAC